MNDSTTPTSASFPDRLNRLSESFMEAKILYAAVELGLPDRLAHGPANLSTLVAEGFGTARGLEILLDALTALGYTTKTEGMYANSPDSDRYLVRERPTSLAASLAHRNSLFRSWAVLEEVVRHGRTVPEEDKPTLRDPVHNRNFILAMAEASRHRVEAVIEQLPLAGVRRLVDLGGGPGHYACGAVRRWPELTATVVDLQLTIRVATEQIAAQGLSHRVSTLVCDFFREDPLELGGLADLIFISQVLHAEGPEQGRELLRKVYPHVRPGGCVVISENTVDPTRTSPRAGALFAVNMLAGTQRGRTYTTDELGGWLQAAGFQVEPPCFLAERTTLLTGWRAS